MTALGRLLGESPAMVAIREQVGRLLRSAGAPGRRLPPILILGETGTGKGLLAATIYRASGRAGAPRWSGKPARPVTGRRGWRNAKPSSRVSWPTPSGS